MTTLMRSLPAILAASAASLLASQSYAQDPAPIALTDTSGTTTTLTQRSDGFDVSVSDARGVTTHYSYGSTGALQSETAPERGTLRYRYDETGRLDRLQQEDGLVTALSYDDQNRLTRQVWRQNDMDKIVTRLTHDDCDNGEGKLCRVRHNDHVTRYAYTPTGQLSAVHVRMADEDQVETLRYRYNDDGQLQTLRYPSGLLLRYRYADTGRLSDIIGRYETGDDRARFVVAKNIAYDAVGRIESYTHGNGVRTKLTRTEDGNLKRITLRRDGTVLDRSTFRWNGDGRLEAIDRLNTEQSRRFGYDGSGRLIFDARGDGTADRTTTVGYSYDAVGNRLTRTSGIQTRNYNYAPYSNRLTARGRDQMVHDARGNLREDRQGRRAFDYDPTNRMVAFHRDGELRSEYDYDMQGRRIRKRLHRPDADGVRSVRFVYDTEGRLVSETRRRDDRSAVKARDIVWLGSLPLAQIERRVRGDGTTRSADVLSLHPGHLGELREARDASGTVVWRWGGDAFGAKIGGTPAVNRDPDGDGVNTSVSLRFPGQYHDRESGLFYNHHRDYDPKLGRYIQSDPIGLAGGVNRYGYVSGDPVNFVDPTGLIASPMGGMYHKDAHDGIGGLYGPGGSMEDDYVMFSGWTMQTFGQTGMEFMAHPDSANYDARMALSRWERGVGEFNPEEFGLDPADFGHYYYIRLPVCPAGSNVSRSEAISILRSSIVPRPNGNRVVVPNQGGRYLVQDPFSGIFGGFVNTTININTLSGTNITDQPHIFEGVVNVRIVLEDDGSVYYSAEGYGTVSGRLSGLRDFINNILGPTTFNGMGIDNIRIADALEICQ